MKLMSTIALLSVLSSTSFASTGKSYTCAQLRNYVHTNGSAVVVKDGQKVRVYPNAQFCGAPEMTYAIAVEAYAADGLCEVGVQCIYRFGL